MLLWKEFVRNASLVPILERRHRNNSNFIGQNITSQATATLNLKG